MYHLSAQGVDERMINVHYYFYFDDDDDDDDGVENNGTLHSSRHRVNNNKTRVAVSLFRLRRSSHCGHVQQTRRARCGSARHVPGSRSARHVHRPCSAAIRTPASPVRLRRQRPPGLFWHDDLVLMLCLSLLSVGSSAEICL